MARARWRTGRPDAVAQLVALGCAAATATASAWAQADVGLIPAADGQLGAWMVAGPLSATAAAQLTPEKIQPGSGSPRFRLLHVRDGALDLDRALGTRKKAGAHALLLGDLELREALDGWLLVSVDGRFSAFVDGREVHRRPTAHLRGRSWEPIPLRVGAGRHRVVLELEHPGTWWAAELRVLDATNLMPPRGARLSLPGSNDKEAERLLREMLTVDLDAGSTASAHFPILSLEYRRGVPANLELTTTLSWVGPGREQRQMRAGSIPAGEHGVYPFVVALPALDAAHASQRRDVEVAIGRTKLRVSTRIDADIPRLLRRSEAALEKLRSSKLTDAGVVRSTLQHFSAELRRGSQAAKPLLESWLAELEAGRDPLTRPGRVSLARESQVDGEPDPLVLHVPQSFTAGSSKRYPLVVALHGLNGTPERIVDAFLGSGGTRPSVDGFVLAPYAHGNAFYRGPGELEVLAAIDWVLGAYPVDPERVSITGVSMGGTGTAHLALRYADRFAAAAPLCGYHSYFVRRDTSKRPIRPWEEQRMHHWSPASWAERGRDLPMWVAHGTRDFPLENSKVLVERYKQLGYAMTDEWPDTGHDVWTKAYAGARLWPWLTRAKLDHDPARVTIKTDSLRFGKRAWASITRLAKPGYISQLDATLDSPRRARVTTSSVDAFELVRHAPRIEPRESVELEVDGQKLVFDAGETLSARRSEGTWHKGGPAPGGKRAGLEGPIRDAFLEPLVFTYGTGDPRTLRANREVALSLARTRHGPDVAYRVMADVELDTATETSHAVVAVGSARDHALLAAVSSQLPIRIEGQSVVVGTTRHSGGGTGAIFIHENPRSPGRYLVVVTGVDAAGIWRALSLPQLMPDFLVYDGGLAAAANEVVLGRDARVLAGGFFDSAWRLPAKTADAPREP